MPATLNHPYATPITTSGYLIVAAYPNGEGGQVLLHYGAPDGGLFPNQAAAELWAGTYVSGPWSVVPVSRTTAPPSQDPRIVAAAKYLTAQGLRVLEMQWECSEGTLDIVAADRRTLVVVDIIESRVSPIARKRQTRLRRLAVRWVVAHGFLFDEVRVDRVAVQQDGTRGLAVTRYEKGVG
jgi:putative endonuclease